MSEQEKEAALAFARSKAHEWDAYYAQYQREHPAPIVESPPEAEPPLEEPPRKRKSKEESEDV